jgi:hypothetical protein
MIQITRPVAARAKWAKMATTFSSARSAPLLEPPGFLLLNYGRSTPLVMLVVHAVYGAVVGGFTALS